MNFRKITLSLAVALGAATPVQAADSTPYAFEWTNSSGGHSRKVEVRCTKKSCSGKVMENRDLLFKAQLPLEQTVSRIRNLENDLAAMRPCSKEIKSRSADFSTLAWRIRYFSATLSGSRRSNTIDCQASDRTLPEAEALMVQIEKESKSAGAIVK